MAQTKVPTRRRIGEILVELGLVTEEQISSALEEQRATGTRLGDVLLKSGYVMPRDLVRALAVQFGLSFVDLDHHRIDPDVAQLVPQSLARRHRAVPVWREGQKIVVAMANPVDVLALDDIRARVGHQVEAVMAEGAQILSVVEGLGHSDSRVQETIQAAVVETGELADARAIDASDLQIDEDDDKAPIVRFVDLLLAKAIQERASDVHVEPTSNDLRIRFRVDGVLHDAMSPPRSLRAGIVSRIRGHGRHRHRRASAPPGRPVDRHRQR